VGRAPRKTALRNVCCLGVTVNTNMAMAWFAMPAPMTTVMREGEPSLALTLAQLDDFLSVGERAEQAVLL